jgi:hypothetical protein
MYERISLPGKIEVHHMVQINERVSVNAEEMLRVQPSVEVFDRHSMLVTRSLQVQLKQVAVTLNPQYVAYGD